MVRPRYILASSWFQFRQAARLTTNLTHQKSSSGYKLPNVNHSVSSIYRYWFFPKLNLVCLGLFWAGSRGTPSGLLYNDTGRSCKSPNIRFDPSYRVTAHSFIIHAVFTPLWYRPSAAAGLRYLLYHQHPAQPHHQQPLALNHFRSCALRNKHMNTGFIHMSSNNVFHNPRPSMGLWGSIRFHGIDRLFCLTQPLHAKYFKLD